MLASKPLWWSTDHWETPLEIVAMLEKEFGRFDLDPCCRPETAKADKFFTESENGLSQKWFGKVFMNPPYSKPALWTAKALAETKSGNAELVVGLLPVATDTGWFHNNVLGRAELRFHKGRIRFLGWQNTQIPQPRNPNLFAIWRG